MPVAQNVIRENPAPAVKSASLNHWLGQQFSSSVSHFLLLLY
jgi:hypothetical protein